MRSGDVMDRGIVLIGVMSLTVVSTPPPTPTFHRKGEFHCDAGLYINDKWNSNEHTQHKLELTLFTILNSKLNVIQC